MGKFSKYRIHFDITKKTGLLKAHSDVIKVSQIEEYQEAFGCGYGSSHSITGEVYWQADRPNEEENSRRLAREWLDEMEDQYPNKAVVIRKMLDANN